MGGGHGGLFWGFSKPIFDQPEGGVSGCHPVFFWMSPTILCKEDLGLAAWMCILDITVIHS